MRHRTKNHQGFTLIELLLYVSVVGSLLLTAIGFFATISGDRIKNQSISEVNQQASVVMGYLARTIRGASSITSPTAGATATGLTLTVPTASLSPTVFNLSSGIMRVTEGSGSSVALNGGQVTISNVTIKNLTRSGTKGTVQVSFLATHVNTSGRNEYDYQKTFVTSVSIR